MWPLILDHAAAVHGHGTLWVAYPSLQVHTQARTQTDPILAALMITVASCVWLEFTVHSDEVPYPRRHPTARIAVTPLPDQSPHNETCANLLALGRTWMPSLRQLNTVRSLILRCSHSNLKSKTEHTELCRCMVCNPPAQKRHAKHTTHTR